MKKQIVVYLVVFFLCFISPHIILSATPDTTDWSPPRFSERQVERHRMVNTQITSRDVDSEQVLAAMKNVPRHLFIPKSQRRNAYRDRPLPIGQGQTISQPYIVAYMTEILQLEPGEKVLEIGTGSGYQAAVLSEITREIYSIEIIEALGKQARERLSSLGYNVVKVKIGDGYSGWKENAPFDAIIVTAAAGHIPPPLLQQLKQDGIMVIPVGSPYLTQTLIKLTKSPDGKIRTRSLMPVRFVPMTGKTLEKE